MKESMAYPRPDFDRSSEWFSLDGLWEFRRLSPADADQSAVAGAFEETIEVPFPWESKRSGVGAQWLVAGAYRRRVSVPGTWNDRRAIVHFGGVHHRSQVFANGTLLFEHEGIGPFECDITDHLSAGSVDLVVLVDAPLDKRYICHGKQRSIPVDDYDSCAFQPTSGIWQSVWLEPRPATFVRRVRAQATTRLDGFDVQFEVDGPRATEARLHIQLLDADCRVVAEETGVGSSAGVVLRPDTPRRWSPPDPYLYTLHVCLVSPDGQDDVDIPVGLRRIEVAGPELRLNGERLFLRGVLDQGYWPDTGLTPPSVDALVEDLALARAGGYNLVRKHLKIEDPRWLHAADRMGMLVWAEPPSTGRYSPQSVMAFQESLRRMVARDGNHPAVVVWGAFNEEWGLDWSVAERPELQSEVKKAAQLLRALDGTRPVVDNSGWAHVDTDLVDWHYYEPELSTWRKNVAALVGDESAEIPVPLRPPALEMKRLFAVPQQLRRPNLNSEYGWGSTSLERGWHLKWQTQELRRHDLLAGYVYTELCDVEHEFAGIYRADRSRKDLGNMDPADANAETVLVLEVLPLAPGCDLESSGAVMVDVCVSHHGHEAIQGRLTWQWGALLGEAPQRWNCRESTELGALPFVLGRGARVETRLPEDWPQGRLHLALLVDGKLRARSALDVVRRRP